MVVIDKYWECAQITSNLCGIDAKWIYAHWVHESNNFTNWGATKAHNFAGIKKFRDQPEWFTGDATSPEGDEYQVFEDDSAFAVYFAKYLSLYREDGIFEAVTLEGYARALRHGGYYGNMPGMTAEESIDNYANGLQNAYNEAFG